MKLFYKIFPVTKCWCRYHWSKFAVVTSDIAGHDDFVQAVREEVGRMWEELSIK